VAPFDFDDERTIQAAVAGVDTIYLASPGPMNPAPVKRVVDYAQAAGVKRIVRLSAMGVEQGDSPLRQIEQHIEGSDLEWTFLRPSWFLQNYSTMHAQTIAEQGAFYEPAGNGKTSFIDARDIAAVAVHTLTQDGHHGQAYVLTGGQAYDRYEVAQAIAQAIDKNVHYVPVEDAQFRESMAAFEGPQTYVDLMSNLYNFVRAGWTEQTTDTVPNLLGRAPITLEQFAADHRSSWL
jgi:uncharacterized protein YbjT (DUF2867 family)